MFLISVAGSADELEPLWTDVVMIDSKATVDENGVWTVVGYADAAALDALENLGISVEIIDDEDTVAAQLDAALGDIEETPPLL